MTTLFALLLSAPFLASPAAADEVELTSGTVIEGKVQDLGDSIKVTRAGGSVVYPKSMIRKITPKKTVEELYEEKARELKPDDAEARLKLARWCVEKKLAKEAVIEFKKVVALQPDHEEARKGAGYRKLGDKWLTDDEFHEAQGLVRHKGRWVTPEQRDLETALEEQKELDQALLQEVKALVERVRSTDEKKREEAIAGLAKIEDKFKVKAYLGAIASSSKHLRQFVFEELGRMKEVSALRPLVRRSLWDEDEALRPVAFRAVTAIGHPDTALLFVPFLGEESISARVRCLDALGTFKDLRVVPALLETMESNLETTKYYEQYGGQMTAVTGKTLFLRDGSRITLPKVVRLKTEGLDKDSRAKLQLELATLIQTLGANTGQNFGDDLGRWRAWYEKNKK